MTSERWLDRSLDLGRRYGTALVAVGITAAVKLLIDGLGDEHPFVLLAMPVAVAAWFGGRGPGVLAAVLITVLGASFVGPDLLRDTSDLVALIAVAVQAAAVVAITVALRTALVRARESAHAAEEARRELKFAVAVRDEVLRVWSEKVRGPLARLEVVASDALEGLERDGYRGAATRSLRALVDDAGMLRRVTANWNPTSFPAKTDEI